MVSLKTLPMDDRNRNKIGIFFIICTPSKYWTSNRIYTVAYRPVSRQRPRNDKETTAVAMQRRGKHTSVTMELLLETVFLTRSCKGVIRKTTEATQSVLSQRSESAVHEPNCVSSSPCCKSVTRPVDMEGCEEKSCCRSAAVKRRLYVWYLECVIQWDCYSSCVKIRCQETASGDCNTQRTLVCVCQWSANCSSEWCV
jgi:hypothetical protein